MQDAAPRSKLCPTKAEEAAMARERHRCEVRVLLEAHHSGVGGRAWVHGYLTHKLVAGRAERLRASLNEQLKKGNTGKPGEWL